MGPAAGTVIIPYLIAIHIDSSLQQQVISPVNGNRCSTTCPGTVYDIRKIVGEWIYRYLDRRNYSNNRSFKLIVDCFDRTTAIAQVRLFQS